MKNSSFLIRHRAEVEDNFQDSRISKATEIKATERKKCRRSRLGWRLVGRAALDAEV